MLFLGPGKIEPERVHGAFIADDEVNRICDAWRERGVPNYVDEILTPFDEEPSSRGFEDGGDGGSDRDALYDQCVAFVLETRKASTSSLQRKFSLVITVLHGSLTRWKKMALSAQWVPMVSVRFWFKSRISSDKKPA